MSSVGSNTSTLRARLIALLSDPQREDDLKNWLPEVAALRGVPQRSDCHGEGDALTHTRLALEVLDVNSDERVVWAVLLHDIGKAETTRLLDGDWRAYGHAEHGAAMVPPILHRCEAHVPADDVVWLVRHHQFHLSWQNLRTQAPLSGRQLRFCHHPLFPLLLEVCRSDALASLGSSKNELLNRLAKLVEASPTSTT